MYVNFLCSLKFISCYVHIATYKPLLDEVEKILAEAGLDEEEMRGAAAGGSGVNLGQNRNRR